MSKTRASNAYGQHIQAQQILIAHIRGDPVNHADADVPAHIVRLHGACALSRVESDAVVADAQDQVVALVYHAYVDVVRFPVHLEAVKDDVACHLLHAQAGEICPAPVDAALQAEIADLTGDCHHLCHGVHADVNTLVFRYADPLRNRHQLLHITREAPAHHPRVHDDHQGAENAVAGIGEVQAVHLHGGDQQKAEQHHADHPVHRRQKDGENLLFRSLRVACEMDADHGPRHAQRQQAKAHHGHLIHGLGRVAVKQAGQRFGQQDKQRHDRTHHEHALRHRDLHRIYQGSAILLPDADAEEHPADGGHAEGNRPDDCQQRIGRGERGDTDAPDIFQHQDIHDQTAQHFPKAGDRAGIAEPDDLRALLALPGAQGEAQLRLPAQEVDGLNAEKRPV